MFVSFSVMGESAVVNIHRVCYVIVQHSNGDLVISCFRPTGVGRLGELDSLERSERSLPWIQQRRRVILRQTQNDV